MSDSSPEPEPLENADPEVIDVDLDSNSEKLEEMKAETDPDPREPSMEVTFRLNNFQSSTKLDALMRDLRMYQSTFLSSYISHFL